MKREFGYRKSGRFVRSALILSALTLASFASIGDARATHHPSCGDGILDPGESCDLGSSNGAPDSCCSGTCTFKSSGTQCRAAAGECDLAETCSGSSGICPADAKKPNGTACTSDSNPCTLDQCNGASSTCQHPAGNAGAVCRAAAGECDIAETCTGASTSCPSDAKVPNGTACTDDGNVCTLDRCDGSQVSCQHPAGNAGTVCRPSAGDCDVAESCTGSSTSCPADSFLPATTLCRASTDVCDQAEYCTGSSAACPADTFVPGQTACWVQSLGTSGDENASTQISIVLNGSVVLGHRVIVTVAMDPDAGAVSCADSRGNLYGLDADVTNGSGTTGVRALAFSAPMTTALAAGDAITVTFANSIAAKAISAADFVGIGAADKTAETTGNDLSPSSGPTSPTVRPNELLMGVIGVETKLNQTFTGGAGYTVLDRAQSDPNAGNPGRHVTIDPEFQLVGAIGSYDADGVLGGPRAWAAAIVTYRAGSVCGDGVLDPGEACDAGPANGTIGSCCTASCTFSAADQVCRAAAGVCDVAENCTGSSAACPADAVQTAGSACGDDGNPCTVDVCDGVSAACGHPAGNAGAVCRPSAGACDLPEICTGADAACPADAKSTAECRASQGICDLAESCDGVSNDCPADAFQPAGTECRPSTATCDPAESCTGTAASCPPDDINKPSEVAGVALSRDPSTTTIAWSGDPGDLFNVYRGSKRGGTSWSYNQSCLATDLPDFSITDSLNPGAGTVFYYLVSRVDNHCGESVLGRGSIATVIEDTPMVGQCLGPIVDSDGDGVEDALDNCPDVANADQSDVDGDDHGDACDDCPSDYDPQQTDANHNGIGDACEIP
jgi:hypothetical protein